MNAGKRRRPPWLAALGVALVAIGAGTDNLPLILSGVAFNLSYLLGWPDSDS